MSERFSIIDDLSKPELKSRLVKQIWALQGIWRVEACRYRPRRSDRQNRWYHPCFVAPFAEYLLEQGNQFASPHEAAHGILKREFLTVRVADKRTGVVREYVRSTTELTTLEFNRYLDECAELLARECGIIVPEPNIYHEPVEARKESRELSAF